MQLSSSALPEGAPGLGEVRDGRVAFIDADDIAAVAAHALADPVAHNTEHILTGPRALGYDEAAMIVARHLGRPVRTFEEFCARSFRCAQAM